jgi:hypothetical protein
MDGPPLGGPFRFFNYLRLPARSAEIDGIPTDRLHSIPMPSDFHFMASFCTLLACRLCGLTIEPSYRRSVSPHHSSSEESLNELEQLPLLDK